MNYKLTIAQKKFLDKVMADNPHIKTLGHLLWKDWVILRDMNNTAILQMEADAYIRDKKAKEGDLKNRSELEA